jgi:hypothetical protein
MAADDIESKKNEDTKSMQSKSVPPESSLPASPANGHAQVPTFPVFRTTVGSRTVYVQKLNPRTRITPQARCYAIEELARRAGVPSSFYRSWKITSDQYKTVVHIANGRDVQITFPHASAELLRDLAQGRIRTSRACWMRQPGGTKGNMVPDFLVPFSQPGADSTPIKPLFVAKSPDHVECTVDLPLSILLTLSRWEETLHEERDGHGRFSSAQSVASRDGFLHRPIVDEYGFALEQALTFIYPSWQESRRTLRVKLSHDADHIGIPFGWKQVLRHTTHYKNPNNSCRELWNLFSGAPPSELRSVQDIARLSIERKLDASVYWMASSRGNWDSGYDPRLPAVRNVIQWLDDNQIENGFQAGYNTFRAPEKLRREVAVLREVLGDRPLGGRQHYLRWCPETWIHWETSGLRYDSTVGYADRIGFRAGTCIPYRPWLFALNRPAELLEIPLLVMDGTLVVYMKLQEEESVSQVQDVLNRCRAVGGVFTLVWHNNHLLDPQYRSLYVRLLNLVESGVPYSWKAEAGS